MTTIKSFSDLEQSKKLAEILPIESADMCYLKREFNDTYIETPILKPKGGVEKSLNCWSLAALLYIIPQEIFDGEYIINITEGLDNKWIISYDPSYNVSSYLSASGDNLIDCCVEMIIKLKERNLL